MTPSRAWSLSQLAVLVVLVDAFLGEVHAARPLAVDHEIGAVGALLDPGRALPVAPVDPLAVKLGRLLDVGVRRDEGRFGHGCSPFRRRKLDAAGRR
jgi:hypothetical protein